MSAKRLRIIGVLWVAGLVSFLQASPARGFAVYDLPNYGYVDLVTNPHQFASWDSDTPGGNVTTLTFRFDSSFTTDERIRDQVRLGFERWDRANVTPYGATYSYLRTTGYQPFYDIRDTTVHETGDVLSLHDLTPAPINRNYGFDPTPPPTLVAQPRRDDECMSYGWTLNRGPGS